MPQSLAGLLAGPYGDQMIKTKDLRGQLSAISNQSEALGHPTSPATVPVTSQRITRSQTTNICTIPTHNVERESDTRYIISRIELTFESILDSITGDASEVVIPYLNRPRASRQIRNPDSALNDELEQATKPKVPSSSANGCVKFPGRTSLEAKKFTAVLCILRIVYEAILSGRLVTKRNVFYQNPELFETQDAVDDLVDDLAYTLGVGRNVLNIVATAKGLFTGPMNIAMSNGSLILGTSVHQHGTLIPPLSAIRQIDFVTTRWLLVVEKDATFRTLSTSRFWLQSKAGPGVLITAKGFPDLSTREFLHAVMQLRPQLPMFGLFDFDPDGIAILRTYKHGSLRLGHEERCTVPSMRWIGIRSGDIIKFAENLSAQRNTQPSVVQECIPSSGERFVTPEEQQAQCMGDMVTVMSNRDRKKAVDILTSICSNDLFDADEREQTLELQRMLVMGVKAEIQAVDHFGDVAGWLEEHILLEMA